MPLGARDRAARRGAADGAPRACGGGGRPGGGARRRRGRGPPCDRRTRRGPGAAAATHRDGGPGRGRAAAGALGGSRASSRWGRAMTPGYDYFDVEADVGVIGRGPTAAEAFVQTALGVFALIVEPGSVEVRDRREVRAHAETIESLLVSWINECLYVHEVEGFVARAVDLEVFE